MDDSEIFIETRAEGTNVRTGIIPVGDVDFTFQDEFNNVGSWSLTLPATHPMVSKLTAGTGIIVSRFSYIGTDTLMSGPLTGIETHVTANDPDGTITFTGATDMVALSDRVVIPPTVAAGVTSTGVVEDLMHYFVERNAGPLATDVDRRSLLMGLSQNLGTTVHTVTARYDNLAELVAKIATLESDVVMRFYVLQAVTSTDIYFRTAAVADKTATVRFSVDEGSLTEYKALTAPPTTNYAIVSGSYSGPASADAEDEIHTVSSNSLDYWNRRIERYYDNKDLKTWLDLVGHAERIIAAEGYPSTDILAKPADGSINTYGRTWNLGDTVSVLTSQGVATPATVKSVVVKVLRGEVQVSAILGKPETFSPAIAASNRVATTEKRVETLERATGEFESGWTTTGVTALTGWSMSATHMRRVGSMISLTLDISRTGATITANSAGNFANVDACTLPGGFRPPHTVIGVFHVGGGVTSGSFQLTAAGVLTVCDMHPTSTIDAGDLVRAHITYLA